MDDLETGKHSFEKVDEGIYKGTSIVRLGDGEFFFVEIPEDATKEQALLALIISSKGKRTHNIAMQLADIGGNIETIDDKRYYRLWASMEIAKDYQLALKFAIERNITAQEVEEMMSGKREYPDLSPGEDTRTKVSETLES
jgi:hypothetical protein